MRKRLNPANIAHMVRQRSPFLLGIGILIFTIMLLMSNARHNALSGIPFKYVVVDEHGPVDPWLKTVGDLNGDQRPDLIVGGNSGGGLAWYENPDWVQHIIAAEGQFSTDAEVADVDNDGDNDLIVLTVSDIRWYENPTWQVHIIDNRVLHDLEVADFDGDGKVDLVGRNQGEFGQRGDELHFYRQNSPTSWSHRALPITDGEGLKVADIDQDGDLDVVINGSWFENPGDILDGAWPEHVYTTSWDFPNSFIDVADVNGDGRPDIVLAPSELAGQRYRISWFEAPEDPKQGVWIEHIVDPDVEAVQHFVGIADMDNDGDMDIVAAEMEQGDDPDEIIIYVNGDRRGTSWTKQVIATTGSHSMRLLDVDNDGDVDLFGANWQGSRIELWLNQSCSPGRQLWKRQVIDENRPWRAIFVTAADIDGDGWQDVITGGWWYRNPGSPDGEWSRMEIGKPLNNMAIVYDFDGDGKMDILGTQGKGADADARIVWAHNQGGGQFEILENIEAGEGDFLQGVAMLPPANGQGWIVALSWHGTGAGIQALTLPANLRTESWRWSRLSTVSQDEDLSSGDIDGDGDYDLLLGTIWLENKGDEWREHTLHDTTGAPYGESDPDRNRLADINGNGRLDAVVGYEAISVSGLIAWYEQGEDATAPWQEHRITTVIGPMSLDVADMDGDGDLDIVIGEHNLDDPASARLYIFENSDGRGGKWILHEIDTGYEHHDGAQTVDIDGDGDLDIISIGWGHGSVLLYENQTPKCDFPNTPNQLKGFLPFILH
jgi:hypothetical protein